MTDSTANKSHISPPCILVIFGAAGDLTKRKLIPALYNLRKNDLLPDNFAIIGVARAEMDTAEFQSRLRDDMKDFATEKVAPEVWDWIEQRLSYLSGDFDDEQTFAHLKDALEKLDREHDTRGNYCFYLATAPQYFAPVIQRLGAAGLTKEGKDRWRRVIIEKPFGSDLKSAQKLNRDIKRVLKEDQIYRIDHYLGKETVQNILVFRFGNGIFEPIWNRRYIECVQITAAEKVGVEQRGGYYEQAGALRDMVPNHLLQLVTLHAIQCPSPEEAARRSVRGQYDAGLSDGQPVPAYRSEPNVAPDSNVDTFV